MTEQATEREVLELKAERARLAAIIESTSDYVSTFKPDGRIIYFNDAARRMMGWIDDTVLQTHRITDAHPDWASRLIMEEAIPTAIETGTWTGETAVLTRDGTEIPVSQVIMSHKSPDGKVEYLSTIMRDIRDYKGMEQSLGESETRFRQLFEQVPVPYQSLDSNGCFIDVNPAWLTTMGYARSEVIGRSFEDFINPLQRQWFRERFPHFKAKGQVSGVEFEMERKDGSRFQVSFEGRISYTEDGDFKQTHCVFIDITERKQVEDSLRSNEQRFRQIFASAPVSIWDEDFTAVGQWLEGLRRRGVRDLEAFLQQEPQALEHALSLVHLVDVNDTTLRLFEVDSKEELLRIWSTLFTEDTFEVFREEVRAIWEGRDRVDCECSARTAGGRCIHYRMHWAASLENGRLNLGRVIVALADITDLKQTEEAVRQSQARYVGLFDFMREGVAIYEAVGNGEDFYFKDMNPAGERTHQVHRDEIVGRSVQEVFPGVKDLGLLEVFQDVWKTGEPRYHPVSQYKDHRIDTWVENYVFKLPSGDIVAVYQNVTEKKRIEQSLMESEANLDRAGRIAHVGYWSRDLSTGDIYWSDETYRIFGLEPQSMALTMTKLFNHVHPEDRQKVGQTIQEAVGGVQPYEQEYRVLRPDGTVRRVQTKGEVSSDHHGNPVRIFGMTLDITELKEAEETLRESETRYALAQQAAGIGTWEWNIDTDTVYWSEDAESLFGLQKGEFNGTFGGVESRIHPDDLAVWYESIHRCLEEGSDHDLEYRVVWSDGSIHWLHALGNIIVDAQKGPPKMIGIVTDITARKKAERERQGYQQRLRFLASELSLAEERERRRIAAGLHDEACQTLALSKIKLQQLQTSLPLEEDQSLTDICTLLDQTLDSVRKMTFDLSSPTLYRFGLAAALKELLMERFRVEHGIQCLFRDDGIDKPLAEDISIMLFQSVRELLINVVKHARAQEVILEISRFEDSIRITVADDGVGFDATDIDFGPSQDHGFGLFNIRERLDLLGGRLEIETQPGMGCRFVLIAPLKTSDEMDKENNDEHQDFVSG